MRPTDKRDDHYVLPLDCLAATELFLFFFSFLLWIFRFQDTSYIPYRNKLHFCVYFLDVPISQKGIKLT